MKINIKFFRRLTFFMWLIVFLKLILLFVSWVFGWIAFNKLLLSVSVYIDVCAACVILPYLIYVAIPIIKSMFNDHD